MINYSILKIKLLSIIESIDDYTSEPIISVPCTTLKNNLDNDTMTIDILEYCCNTIEDWYKDNLSHILFNLISNVIRYGNDGKYLGIFLREDKANIYIDVTDKGKGIKKEFASNVFDRLYTMEDSRNREIQGNGLGLTIAKNLAVQLGGDIFLESIPNIKTTFTVKLKKISY